MFKWKVVILYRCLINMTKIRMGYHVWDIFQQKKNSSLILSLPAINLQEILYFNVKPVNSYEVQTGSQ